MNPVLKQKQPGMWAAFAGSRQAVGRLGPCLPVTAAPYFLASAFLAGAAAARK
jgi:hypothetical protein